jgi:cytochrome c oxidase cbb3-type subunit 2
MAPQTYRPDGKTLLAAVTTVAAVYVYFLIFAQFGFLKAVLAALGEDARAIRPVMAVMGFAGITGSVAAWMLARPPGRRQLMIGLVICAGAAAWAPAAKGAWAFYAIALLTGAGTGLVTVTLAGLLRRAVGDGRLGLIVGLGTGLAYALCNLPVVFEAGATTQARIALLAVAAGMLGGGALGPRMAVELRLERDYSRSGVASWVMIFLVLVCLDSAAFFIIQHTPALKETMWAGGGRLWLNAGVHLGAAVLAGWAFDRRWLGRIVGLGAASLFLACLMISGTFSSAAAAGLFYVAGVSVYSTALVFYPAYGGRTGLAALVYAVAGWTGSGLGIGLAEGREHLPAGLIVGAAAVLAIALWGRGLASRRE